MADDPVFQAIDAHKKAYHAFAACDEAAPEYGMLDQAEAAAGEALLDTAPLTREGARAAIEWLVEYAGKDDCPEVGTRYLSTLLRSPLIA